MEKAETLAFPGSNPARDMSRAFCCFSMGAFVLHEGSCSVKGVLMTKGCMAGLDFGHALSWDVF